MGFKSKNIEWTEVSAAGGSSMLPAGGYVAKMTAIEDMERREYLRITFDIAEGDHKGFFETDDRPYTHQFVRSYTDKAMGFMKKFLELVEQSNAGFSLDGWNNDPNDLVGLIVGIIVQREDYTNSNGEDRARMNVEDFASADDIRNGRYKLPEPKDNRKPHEDTAVSDSGTAYGADIPF